MKGSLQNSSEALALAMRGLASKCSDSATATANHGFGSRLSLRSFHLQPMSHCASHTWTAHVIGALRGTVKLPDENCGAVTLT